MNKFKSLLTGIAAFGLLAFTGCSTDVDPVPVNIPEADLIPNTSLLELKTKFWDDATNYIDTIKLREDGSHYIIAGRVISNDEPGNVFKSLTIQDETCALSFSINSYNLYLEYRVGQEIVIDATDMFIGKYNGLQQMGEPEWYENGNAWEASFMAPEFFKLHAQLNGLPDPSKVDTIEINSFSELPSDPEGLRKFQSQLVKFNNVYFEEGGKAQFSVYKSSGENHNIIDTEGASLPVRTSGYSNFWNKYLPTGSGDVVCLLGYYGTTGWQLTLIDYEGCMNFGNPTIAPGTKDTPYSVTAAIELEASGKSPSGWVTGYIVGTVAPEVVEISSSDDIEWTAEPTLANTLVIATDPECTDVAQCLVLSLPQDSKLREYAALRDNPGVYKKQIWLYGKLEAYMGSWGLTGNKGTADQFKIDGVEIGGGSAANGDGTKETPYNVQQVLGGSASGTAWVTGYIVGTVTDKSIQTDSEFGTANASNTNFLIAMTPDETDYTKCVPVQLPSGDVRTALSLQLHPENLGKQVSVYGSIEKYFGVMGVKAVTEYALGEGGSTGDDDDPVTPPATGDGDGTKDSPYDVKQVLGGSLSGTAWVKGFIVGTVTDKSIQTDSEFGTANASNTNFLLAATATETDYTKCVPVQLPNGDVRTALSLQQHPDNLGKEVLIYGSIEKYFGVIGVKTVTEYVLGDGGSTGGDPVTPPVGGGDDDDDPVTPPATGDGATILATQITNVPGTTTVDGYTIVIDKASGATNPGAHSGTSAIRLYADNTIEISGPTMTSITFTLASDAAFRYTTVDCSTGSISPTQAEGDTSFTWVGDASSVTFTVGHDATLGTDGADKRGQIRFTQLDIK
ncbi:MAG: hypothetical protein HDS75_00525 [Bacteroidales bacterium]|nr:hypothetical protein [Bacteroidales bacterium]